MVDYGETLLYAACSKGHTEIVKLLIENGAIVNLLSSNEKTTPLYQASKKGYTEIVKLLIENGADINLADQPDRTPLYCAYFKGHNEIVELFLENKATTRESKENLLFLSCSKGNYEVVKLLIKHRVEVNLDNESDGTPLGLACSEGHTEIVKLLIENDANVNAINNYGATPLYWACSESHTEIVRLLADAGANVNLPDSRGVTFLYSACSNDQTEVVNLLTNKGAKVNLASNSGRTPLYHASKKGNPKIVKRLINYGANVGAASNSGRTPLCRAHLEGHREIVELLIYSAMLQNIDEETPRFIQQNEKLSAVWDTLSKIEAIKKIKKLRFSFYDLTEKDTDILARSIKNRDLEFLREQLFPDYTDGLKKKLEEIYLHKKERNETIDSLLSNSCLKYNMLSSASKQNRNQTVQLNEIVAREILEHLETRELGVLNQAVNVPSSFNNS